MKRKEQILEIADKLVKVTTKLEAEYITNDVQKILLEPDLTEAEVFGLINIIKALGIAEVRAENNVICE